MEHHRLKPMPMGYDERLFTDLYANTKSLRHKLASQIDHRRFGVDHQEILSWFDVKFIHTFSRYYNHQSPELLKAHIIRSLQFFKNRILRYAYSKKNQVNNQCLDITEIQEPCVEHVFDESVYLITEAIKFLKVNLSPEAFQVLECELQPPFYILQRMPEKCTTAKIPGNLIAEYLGLEERKVTQLRKEIQAAFILAKEHFENDKI